MFLRSMFSSPFARSPRSPMAPVTFKSGFDSVDDCALPAYSPAATDHAFSTLSRDKISVGEKIVPTPLESPSTTDEEPYSRPRHGYASSSFSSLASTPHIYISDAYPPPSPPAPVVSLPIPAYHRPFSPPTVCPVSPTDPHSPSSLRVTVQTRTEVERLV